MPGVRLSKRTLLSQCATALLVAACAPGARQGGGAAPSPEKVSGTIEFWYPTDPQGVSGQAVLELINRFQQKYPKITVNGTYTPTGGQQPMLDKLTAAIAGGTPPDIVDFDRFQVPAWAAQGAFNDLTDLAKRDGIKESDYFPFAWREASYRGRLYALPWDTDARALYANTTALADAGLDPKKRPMSFPELDTMTERLARTAEGRITRFGLIPWRGQGRITLWGWAFGGEWYDEKEDRVTATDPKIIAAAEWMASYARRWGYDALTAFQQGLGSRESDPFLTGQIALLADGDWRMADFARYGPNVAYDVWPFPTADGKPFTWAGGWSYVIPMGAKNVPAAWEMAKYFCGKEGQDYYNKATAHIPTHVEAAKDPFYRQDPRHAVFMDLMPYARSRPPIPEGLLLWQEQARAQADIIQLKRTPREALEELNRIVNLEIEKRKAAEKK
jgi:multiple sugar transport system substrate-binding protein